MIILGISAFYHDAAAVLIKDGEILTAAEEERFTRKKHDAEFPAHAIKWCFESAGISPESLNAVAFYEKPLLKFERILETFYSHAPRGYSSFLQAIPAWVGKKIFLKQHIKKQLKKLTGTDLSSIPIFFPEHHLSHAASAFYPSPFQDSAILTIDGVGEWTTTSIACGSQNKITKLKEIHFPDSIGLLYSAFTYYLGFKVNDGEYKLMGLSPYGNAEAEETKKFIQLIREHICKIHDDGSFKLNTSVLCYPYRLVMTNNKKMEDLFGFKKREKDEPAQQHHCNLAMAVQRVAEEIILKLAKHTKEITGSNSLCLAGGVALNCVANGLLQDEKLFEHIFIQPAAGDSGGAVGAALTAHHIYFEKERTVTGNRDNMKGTLLGPSYTNEHAESELIKLNAVYTRENDFTSLGKKIAAAIAEGKIAGWFQGKMELGPRALGNRSILADPRNKTMQQQLNLKIKFRESFRPFAPAVIEEEAADYFSLTGTSPYMLLVKKVAPHLLTTRETQTAKSFTEKINAVRSSLPAITHVDNSARIQTVNKETNPRFYELLQHFKTITGVPVLINTSFNLNNEPIVCTPAEAYHCFMKCGMDILVIENLILYKEDQPAYTSRP